MKLLPLKKLNAEIAQNKKNQIDEGLKLAKKIDVLRETLLTEEKRLETFRTSSVALVRAEVDQLIGEKEILERNIQAIKEELAMLEGISEARWKGLSGDEKIKEIHRLNQVLGERFAKLAKEELLLISQSKELKAQKKINSEKSKETDRLLEIVKDEKEQAGRMLLELEQKIKESEGIIKEKNREILSQQIEISAKSRDLEIKEDSLKRKEKELNDKEIGINDKYQTLLRTIERSKVIIK